MLNPALLFLYCWDIISIMVVIIEKISIVIISQTIRTVFIYYCCETCPALYYNTYEKVHRNNCYLKNHRHMLSQ